MKGTDAKTQLVDYPAPSDVMDVLEAEASEGLGFQIRNRTLGSLDVCTLHRVGNDNASHEDLFEKLKEEFQFVLIGPVFDARTRTIVDRVSVHFSMWNRIEEIIHFLQNQTMHELVIVPKTALSLTSFRSFKADAPQVFRRPRLWSWMRQEHVLLAKLYTIMQLGTEGCRDTVLLSVFDKLEQPVALADRGNWTTQAGQSFADALKSLLEVHRPELVIPSASSRRTEAQDQICRKHGLLHHGAWRGYPRAS